MTKNARLFDKRVVDRNIDKGLITQDDVNAHLASLPDMENESELLLVEADDIDDDDADEAEAENPSYNFAAPEEEGPKNVYDF